MGWPDWGGPGSPVYPGDPLSEGVNQYGASGLYGSRGRGQVSSYANPDFPSFSPTETGAYRANRPIMTSGRHDGTPSSMQEWIAAAKPRRPFRYPLDPAVTPVPSTDVVSEEGPKSRKFPRNETKEAPKKGLPRESPRGSVSGWVFYKGRPISWPL